MPFPYSSQSHTATAQTGPFSYSNVSLLTDVPVKDQIKVYLSGQLKTLTTDYTLTANETVTFNSAVTGTVKIARESDLDNKEVTFTNSSVLTAQDLNKNSDQLLFLCQELYDKAQNIAIASVGSVVDNAITEAKLDKSVGAEAVTTSTIRDLAVTEAKIGAGAVTEAKIGSGAVTETKIFDGSVTVNKIGSNAVTETKILDASVTPAKLSTGAPSWDISGNLTVSGNITGGALAYPAIASTTATTRQTYATASPHARADAVAIAALNTTITTKRNSSKVLVRFVINYEASHQHGAFILFRGTTEIGSNTDATPGNRNYGIASVDATSNTIPGQTVIEYLDTPGNAGSYTYSVKAYYRAVAFTVYLNGTSTDNTDDNSRERMSSTCILQEIFQ